MLITAIEKQKNGFYAVYVEGEYLLSLAGETVLESGLRAGDTVSREDLFSLKHRAELRRARERALYLLGRRAHTRKELSDKLCRVVEAPVAQQVVQRMEELGLINDYDFAQRYLRDLAHRKGYGAARLRQEMRKKGLSSEIIDQALGEFAQQEEPREALRTLISRRYEHSLSSEKGRARTIAALQRRGYQYADIRAVLAEFACPPSECCFDGP